MIEENRVTYVLCTYWVLSTQLHRAQHTKIAFPTIPIGLGLFDLHRQVPGRDSGASVLGEKCN